MEQQAQVLYESGDYDAAYDLLQGNDATFLYLRFKAKRILLTAEDRFKYIESIDGDLYHTEKFNKASEDLDAAKSYFNHFDYDECIEYANKVLAELEGIAENVVVNTEPDNTEPDNTEPDSTEPDNTNLNMSSSNENKIILPRYYTIRLLSGERDCLNKIAGYDFIYNDREKWKILWEANKSVLKDSNNPHRIYPGQIIEIPAIGDEKREGTYEPKKEYITE